MVVSDAVLVVAGGGGGGGGVSVFSGTVAGALEVPGIATIIFNIHY